MANIRSFANIEQQFYRYELWEDYQSGMYSPASNNERIQKAVDCLSDEKLCRHYMERVVNEWKISTSVVLTNPDMNPKAWLGQCACFMYAECHDEETRKAWCLMQPKAQKAANKIADEVINKWLSEFAKKFDGYQISIFG